MRIFAFVGVLLGLAMATPAAAQDRVGDWMISGSNGNCLASQLVGNVYLAVITPASDGSNLGGLVVAAEGWDVADGRTTFTLAGNASWAGVRPGFGEPGVGGYFIPFLPSKPASDFPNAFRLTISHDGKQLIDAQVKDFHPALSAAVACAGE